MKVYADVVTTPSSDTPGTAIVVHFDSKRYIFGNVHEGAQRAFVERGVGLGKVSDIFLTGRTEWRTIGGLVGLVLTLGDQQNGGTGAANLPLQGVTLHGGENILHSLATTRSFVFRNTMPLRVDQVEEGSADFTDDNVTVRPLHIMSDNSDIDNDMETPISDMDDSADQDLQNNKRPLNTRNDDPAMRKAVLQSIMEDMFCSDWTMDTMEVDEKAERLSDESGIESPHKRPKLEHQPAGSVEPKPEDFGQLSTTAPPPGRQRAPWPASTIPRLTRTKPCRKALSFIMTLKDQRGKFLVTKATELGVPKGPLRGRLSKGETITTPDGRIVKPEDVLGPTKEGTAIAICEVPDLSYVSSFLSRPEWQDLEATSRLGAFFWILGTGVILDPGLQSFMKSIPTARHIISSPEYCADRLNFQGAARSMALLNTLDSCFFPTLQHNNSPILKIPDGLVAAVPGLRWEIEPKWSLNSSALIEDFDAETEVTPRITETFRKAIAETHALLARVPFEKDMPGADVEIYTLGTGSALPSKYRNVSSTLVRMPTGSLLLDCGENTLGQLKRIFGTSDELHNVLRDIKVIYISHLHADHHLGTVAVLRARYDLLKSEGKQGEQLRLFVLGPARFKKWLHEYSGVEMFGSKHITFLDLQRARAGESPDADVINALHKSIGLTEITSAPARHCLWSYTGALTFALPGSPKPFKICYSGDTRPTTSFVDIGKHCTVLFHEATFENDLLVEAQIKKHSTTGEALKQGRLMGAAGVVLTHFSQRYPKLPVLAEVNGEVHEEWEGMKRVVLGFDCMKVKVGELRKFGTLWGGLEVIYGKRGEADWNFDEGELGEEAKKLKLEKAEEKEKKRKQKNIEKAERRRRETTEKG